MSYHEEVEQFVDDQIEFDITHILNVLAIKFPGLHEIVQNDNTDISSIKIKESIDDHLFQTTIGGLDRVERYLNRKLLVDNLLTIDELEEDGKTKMILSIDKKTIINALRDYSNNIRLSTPTILVPEQNEKLSSTNLYVQSSAFHNDVEGNHVSTDWQIATDSSFTTLVYESLDDTTNLTTLFVTIPANTVLYIRCRYKTSEYISNWSKVVSCIDEFLGIFPPSITNPTNNSVDIYNNVTITSSTFDGGVSGESHVSTDWQIATDNNFTNVVHESLDDTSHLESYSMLNFETIQTNSTYYLRCRYKGANLVSDWCSTVMFTTSEVFDVIEKQKLLAGDGQGSDHFGFDSDISNDGNTIVVSAYGGSQHIYVYTKDTNTNQYNEAQEITAVSPYTNYGERVKLSGDGNWLLTNCTEASLGRCCHVFKRSGNSFSLFVKLEDILVSLSDKVSSDEFGCDFDISDDGMRIVVGASNSSTTNNYTGAVYVFDRDNTDPALATTYIFKQKLAPPDAANGDTLGNSVSISKDGKIVVGGAPTDSNGASYSGSISIWKWNSNTLVYDFIQKASNSSPQNYDYFGKEIETNQDGSILITTSVPGTSYLQHVFIFKLNTSTGLYELIQDLIGSTTNNSLFGNSLDITADGKYFLAGCSGEFVNSIGSGAVYRYKWNNITNTYDEIQVIIPSDGTPAESFGDSVAISEENTVIIGASNDDQLGSDSGSAYVFR
jgi:hypothetical protein